MARCDILARYGLIDAESDTVESCRFAERDDARYILVYYGLAGLCPQVLDLETARKLVDDVEMRGDPLTWKIAVELEAIDSGIYDKPRLQTTSTSH